VHQAGTKLFQFFGIVKPGCTFASSVFPIWYLGLKRGCTIFSFGQLQRNWEFFLLNGVITIKGGERGFTQRHSFEVSHGYLPPTMAEAAGASQNDAGTFTPD
jgi:hypothetical protein